MAQSPVVMRIVALSINTSKKAGEIIRNVMSSKQLNIVEKVCLFAFDICMYP